MILAVDPGLSGALALYDEAQRGLLEVVAMPTFRKDPKSARRFLDEAELWKLMGSWRLLHNCNRFVTEKVNGMPGQSAPGAFTFGTTYAFPLAYARALSMRIDRVEPAMWKRAMRCPASKEAARLRAGEVFPDKAHLWPLKGDDGKAEAALLAKYAGDNLL